MTPSLTTKETGSDFLSKLKNNFWLRAFAITKVPMIFYTGASVLGLSDDTCVISIPFIRRNKNHLGSMYFGVLCVGADVAGGIIAARLLQNVKKGKGSLIFKDFKANFFKRAEGRTVFTCNDGQSIKAAVQKAEESLERVELPVKVIATVPDQFGSEPVAEFILTLSLKVRR